MGFMWLPLSGASSMICPPRRRTSGAYSPMGSTTMIRSWVARNTWINSRLAAKDFPLPVLPRYSPLADFSFFRSAMMTLWDRAFMP